MNSLFGSGLWFFFLAGAVANLALTPLAILLCHRFGVFDHPGHRKVHQEPVPKLGGAAILVSLLAAAVLGFLTTQFNPAFQLNLNREAKVLVILGTTLLAALLGLVDDLWHLKPRHKLMGQALIGLLFAALGYHFQVLHLPGFKPFNLSSLGIPLTALWMMAVINGFNFMDGVDGLAGSVSLSALVGLNILAGFQNNLMVEALSAALMGALLVFLAFNWRPAKVFMGDMGANALGAFCAASLVSLGQGGQTPMGFSTAADIGEPFRFQFIVVTLLVGYPLLEVTLSTFRRGIRSLLFGRSMEWSESEHLHHRLLKMGLGPSPISVIAVAFNAALTAAGLLAMVRQNAWGVLCASPVILLLGAVMPRMGFFDFLDLKRIRLHQPHYQVAHHFIGMQRTKLRLVQDQMELLALINQTCVEFGVQSYRLWTGGKVHEGSHIAWERSPEDHREYLNYLKADPNSDHFHQFKDKIFLDDDRGDAYWTFEPHAEEGPLDVEYRVLVHEFMREALLLMAQLPPGAPKSKVVTFKKSTAPNINSSLLHRRHHSQGKE